MKAAIYSPYLDTFGGGEKYMMTIAEILNHHNFEVDILLDKHLEKIGAANLKDELQKRFNLDLNKTNFIPAPVGAGSSVLPRLLFLNKYKIFIYLTDGSIFIPGAKNNYLHIQSPIIGQPTKSLWAKIELKCWNKIIYNSNFTRDNSLKNWPLNSKVLYPPIDVDIIKPLNKKKYILSVGRFFGYLKDKKHETLIRVFKDLFESGQIKDWSLHLAGSASIGDTKYLDQLKAMSKNLPVEFYPNLEYFDLVKLYGQSIIYWHAAGFEELELTKLEHFGISTVEAMAAGCIPIVIGKGVQVEIVDKDSGFLWNNLDELKDFTLKVINNKSLCAKLSSHAIIAAKKFSKEKFKEGVLKIITEIPNE